MLDASIMRWRPLAERYGGLYGIPTALVLAVIAQESSGNTGASRVERGFWARYAVGIVRNIKATVSRLDDRWLAYPDFVSASYGLMQVLYPVAIERGMKLTFPTELCIPEHGINAGCRHLRHLAHRIAPTLDLLSASDATLEQVLLRYNGGGAPNYGREVLALRDRALEGLS